MKIAASEFKARCLALIDQVHQRGHAITITKRGKVFAKLVPAADIDDRPWLRVRGTLIRYEDPLAPAVDERDIEALKEKAKTSKAQKRGRRVERRERRSPGNRPR